MNDGEAGARNRTSVGSAEAVERIQPASGGNKNLVRRLFAACRRAVLTRLSPGSG